MKHIAFFIVSVLIASLVAAQQRTYIFKKSIADYVELVGATSVGGDSVWDDPDCYVPIGFDFILFGQTLNQLYLGNGFGACASSITVNGGVEHKVDIMPFDADLIDRGYNLNESLSPISYKVEGDPGFRICKIQWKNAGFAMELDETNVSYDYVNVQLWLYEGTNDIEFRYGDWYVTDPELDYEDETGPWLGLENYTTGEAYYPFGSPSSPDIADSLVFLEGTPPEGTVYRFEPVNRLSVPAMNTNAESNVLIDVNTGEITILVANHIPLNSKLTVVDGLGREVYSRYLESSQKISLHGFDQGAGVYYFQVTKDNKLITSGKIFSSK